MLQNLFFILLALFAGTLMPTQAAVNSRLGVYVQHPVLSAFISFAVGTLALIAYLLLSGVPLGNLWAAKNAPWSVWTGGLLGAIFVSAIVLLVPRLGVALTFSLIVAGQMTITLLLDHYGFMGIPVKSINVPRILGVVLVILGVLLIRKY